MFKLLLYVPRIRPRLNYIVEQVFGQWMACRYEISESPDLLKRSGAIKLQYGGAGKHPEADLFLAAHDLLWQDDIRPQSLDWQEREGLPYAFATSSTDSILPFDLLALCFFCLSRYEEYWPGPRDAHGRFSAAQSQAHQAQFLHLPLLDCWLQIFRKKLLALYPNQPFTLPSYHFLPSYDIDMAWSYLHKGWRRQLGALGRAILYGQTAVLKERWQVYLKQQKDPYDVFEQLDEWHNQYGLSPRYFILLGDLGPFDKNISHLQAEFRQLLKGLSQRYPLGIHPSYASNEQEEQLAKEQERLANIIGRPILTSRQHYLWLRFPETYRRLLAIGIEEDYTMGYADAIGFRASTAYPFYWYDLEKEAATSLKLIPFQVMDVTLKQYLKLNPETAIEQIRPMIQQVQQSGGYFVSLWHNSSFTKLEGWENWETVYTQLLAMAQAK